MDEINAIITDVETLRSHYLLRNGFIFSSLPNFGCGFANVFDAIVIRNPSNAACFSPRLGVSNRSLEDHIAFVNKYQLEKAIIIAENIDFIARCPSLKELYVVPADSTGDGFDFSPLYSMPQIKALCCATEYGQFFRNSSSIDYSQISGLQNLRISGIGNKNYNHIPTLKQLDIIGYEKKDLLNFSFIQSFESLSLTESKIVSLKGIEKADSLCDLSLDYNRSLQDVSFLSSIGGALKKLSIDSCARIKDFSFLRHLSNLEYLCLKGNNCIPDLEFLNGMKKLKVFIFSVLVENGDLSPCLNIPYVSCQKNRKHYNFKEKDLPKDRSVRQATV